jgi:Phosphoenolpyruvate phosphomutase
MTDAVEKARRFLELHRGRQPLLLPNPWDRGSAVLLASMGFDALATTSSGFAATLGRADGRVTRDEAVEHAASIVQATDLPVTADLESGFAEQPAGVAETVRLATAAGLAGCSVEDFTGDADDPIYDAALAAARIEAAAEAAHRGPVPLVLTARAENYLHGRPDLADTIDRLQAYQEAGADVLYARCRDLHLLGARGHRRQARRLGLHGLTSGSGPAVVALTRPVTSRRARATSRPVPVGYHQVVGLLGVRSHTSKKESRSWPDTSSYTASKSSVVPVESS